MREKLWARKPFSVNDLACDESGNPVKTEIDSWLIEVKVYIEALEAERDTLKEENDLLKENIEITNKFYDAALDKAKNAESRLAEAEKILNEFFKTPADKEIIYESMACYRALGEVRDILRGEAEG